MAWKNCLSSQRALRFAQQCLSCETLHYGSATCPSHIFFWLKNGACGLVFLVDQNVVNRDWIYSLGYSHKTNSPRQHIWGNSLKRQKADCKRESVDKACDYTIWLQSSCLLSPGRTGRCVLKGKSSRNVWRIPFALQRSATELCRNHSVRETATQKDKEKKALFLFKARHSGKCLSSQH